jgi:deoxyhypusine synthase
VTTGGGVEEDFIKCLAPTFLGDFRLNGEALRKKGLNRIGNLLIPNSNYCSFEDWVNPILHTMTDEQVIDTYICISVTILVLLLLYFPTSNVISLSLTIGSEWSQMDSISYY